MSSISEGIIPAVHSPPKVVTTPVLEVCEDAVSSPDGLAYVLAFISSGLDVAKKKVDDSHPAAKISEKISVASEVLSFVGFISYLTWLVSKEKDQDRRSWQYTAYMATLAATEAYGVVQFLHGVNAVNIMAAEEATLGSLFQVSGSAGRIPVAGTIVNSINLIGNLFSAWYHGRKISRLNGEIEKTRDALRVARDTLDRYSAACVEKGEVIGLDARYDLVSDWVSKEEKEHVRQIHPVRTEEYLHKYARQKLEHKANTLTVELENHKLDKRKAMLGLVNDIVSIALGILLIVGLFASVAALAATAWPMIVLGVLASTFGLYIFWYDRRNLKAELPEKPEFVQAIETLAAHKAAEVAEAEAS